MHRRKKYFGRTIVLNKEKTAVVFLSAVVFVISFCTMRTNLISTDSYVNALGLSVPVFKESFFKEFEFKFDYYSVFSRSLPAVYANKEMQKKYEAIFSSKIKAKREESKEKESVVLDDGKVLEVNSAGGMSFNNATDYNIDLNELKMMGFSLDTSKKEPKVLIISTHSSESYKGSGGRSEDEKKNVLKVGEVLCQTLNKGGIKAVHDKTRNDYPSYNGSYKKALSVIEKNLEKYPSIEIVIDVHRDYMENAEGVKLKPTAKISGKGKAAQIMFVMGTDYMGLEHPNWRENLALAVKLQGVLNEDSPELCRSINVRTERFNQHKTRGSMIVEFGSSENTLEEAMLSAKLLGEAMVKGLK